MEDVAKTRRLLQADKDRKASEATRTGVGHYVARSRKLYGGISIQELSDVLKANMKEDEVRILAKNLLLG